MWLDNGQLLPYPEKDLGPPMGLIPLMAVVQDNRQKVCPVMNLRDLNKQVDTFTADANVARKS